MNGEIDWFSQIFGIVPEGSIKDWNHRVVRSMIRSGLAAVLIKPGDKVPVCTLSAGQAKTADRAAQNAARARGAKRWDKVRHDCGVHHALTAESELTRKRVKDLLASGCNLALAPGASSRRVIVVDVDTPEERGAFLDDWYRAIEGIRGLCAFPLTVTSPGSRILAPDGSAVWAHHGGGHWWFEVPDGVELPTGGRGKYKDPGGWTAYYGSGYVLVPPSVRAEGAYQATGAVTLAPGWLTDRIEASCRARTRQGRSDALRHAEGDDPIDLWSADTPWEDLLIPEGFTPHDHDACGCPTFTRPGNPAHSKSVTAHEDGCGQFDTSKGHGPLHIWSDSVELPGLNGVATVTKLGFVARVRFGGDTIEAMRSLDLASNVIEDEEDDTDLVWSMVGSRNDRPGGGTPKAEPAGRPALTVVPDPVPPDRPAETAARPGGPPCEMTIRAYRRKSLDGPLCPVESGGLVCGRPLIGGSAVCPGHSVVAGSVVA